MEYFPEVSVNQQYIIEGEVEVDTVVVFRVDKDRSQAISADELQTALSNGIVNGCNYSPCRDQLIIIGVCVCVQAPGQHSTQRPCA